MLALTFVNAEDYDKIQEDDTFDFINLEKVSHRILHFKFRLHTQMELRILFLLITRIMNSKLDGLKRVLQFNLIVEEAKKA